MKDAKTNWNTTDISIFQFFVDIFGKEFEFTEEQYDEIIESTVDLEELVLKISECVSPFKFVNNFLINFR